VFEPNNDPLWASVRREIENFLYQEWTSGALVGAKPENAYFVKCDRSTMTQNDLDNGRLVALVGVATVRPAEFVIFRIGQWTRDRKDP
jgi:phage tail sheath protein FI